MPHKADPGVYCWCNKVNGKVYVGGARHSLTGRKCRYIREYLKNGHGHNIHLLRAWNKYGLDNFEFVVLERCPREQVDARENYWLTKLNAANKRYGYNICKVAGSMLGIKHTAATKKKISLARIGKPGPMLGKNHTEETRQKMSLAKKGKPNGRLGKKHTEETKDKIQAKKLGLKASAETRAKMSAIRAGKKMSEAHRQAYKAGHWSKGPNAESIKEKIRQARTGTTIPEEVKTKISATKLAKGDGA